MKTIAALLVIAFSYGVSAQDKKLPYDELANGPTNYSAGAVAARMVDGLGFRFYWATEGLRAEDLRYKPSADARTSEETIQHIYSMSFMILNATTKSLNVDGQDKKISFADMRKKTLENLKTASDNLNRVADKEMKAMNAKFKTGDQTLELPFWNIINGPIADCIWHTGQIVSFRRSSGNPFSENVDVFRGKKGS